jgi:hypothetical protein
LRLGYKTKVIPVNERHTGSRAKELDSRPVSPELRPALATDKQQQLFSRYPLFFRAVRYPEAYPSNLAFFGIQCGLGWYPLIEAAAQEIEAELRSMWCDQAPSIENMASLDYHLLRDESAVFPVIPFCVDIRETEGKLRMPILTGYLCDEEAWPRIVESAQKAMRLARGVCERCGRPGTLREIYWHHVYCDECLAPLNFENPVQPVET